MEYFSEFPLISYANTVARNILSRVKMSDEFLGETSYFYPYVLQEGSVSGTRLENLAFDYYGDPNNVWVLYMSNGVIDPYYDTFLTPENFEKYIIKKYESLRIAQQTIKFFRNNFDQDDTILSIEAYRALTAGVKKYWTPTINYDYQIIGYERAKDLTTISTNKIISLEFITAGNTLFLDGERVVQNITGAIGFVTRVGEFSLSLQHIQGQFEINQTVTGQTSGATGSPTSIITLSNTVPENEQVFFSPVSMYDYEYEINESKKNIQLLEKRFLSVVQTRFKELIK